MQAPMPNPPPRRGGPGKTLGIIGIVLVVLLLLCGGSIFLLAKAGSQMQGSATPTPQATAAPTPTPTLAPNQNPYPPNTGTLVVNDPLQDNSKGYGWPEGSTVVNKNAADVAATNFAGGAYHISRTAVGSFFRGPNAPDLIFSNLAFEVNVTLIKGDSTGLVFRVDPHVDRGYLFVLGALGNYALDTFDFTATNNYRVIRKGSIPNVIKRGLNQSNLVAIVAIGTKLSLYVNHQFVDSIQDSTYSSGRIGILVAGESGGSEVVATNARAWRI
jgi:hypothetical protein